MQILTVLSAIEKIESSVAKLYEWFSEVLAPDEEASGFFFRLAMQERSHANMVSFSKNLVRRSPSDFAAIDFDMALVDDLMDTILQFRVNNPHPSLADALDFAMSVESHGAEGIHRSMVIQSNPEIAKMVNSLANADKEHFKLLQGYAEKIKPSESCLG